MDMSCPEPSTETTLETTTQELEAVSPRSSELVVDDVWGSGLLDLDRTLEAEVPKICVETVWEYRLSSESETQ